MSETSETTLAAEKSNNKLALSYEAIRRQQYELINDLLEVLPKIDGLADDRVAEVRDALFHADNPYLIVFVGPFSSGKSSLINVLLNQADLLPIGPVPTTDRISILRWGEEVQRMQSGEIYTVMHPSPILRKVSFVDTPGLESVFQNHEGITRRFLHRSDTVFLVMLAQQAMTSGNLNYLKVLREYGKNVIILLSQKDLLSAEEIETVRAYVIDQSRDLLGANPEVWAVSAREAQAAYLPDGTRDSEKWIASGVAQIEAYVDGQLGDVERMRQKLQTPLQIVESAHQAALAVVRENQSEMNRYQSIFDNIDQQMAAGQREHARTIRTATEEIEQRFAEVSARGDDAITEMFRFTRAFNSLYRGFLELIGLARFARRAQGGSYTRTAFERQQVFAPISELPAIVSKLGPRIEGRDIQDTDDLVKYAQREVAALPPDVQRKVIGVLQPPQKYDRTALENARPVLSEIEDETQQFETDRLERMTRNTLVYLAGWEVLVIILGIFVLAWNPATPELPLLPFLLIIFLLGMGLLGLAFMPLRGRAIANAYQKRIDGLKNRYTEAVTQAANAQIRNGMQVRREAVAPLTRLIEAQTTLQTEQLNQLRAIEGDIVKVEAELAKLGRANRLGL
ncbi:MAG: hypothetical protein GYB67_00620 [Chloroflexi bacterium]|nr:hypothetical protein [Chloroflexota bacterium]